MHVDMKYFEYEHLSGRKQQVSEQFHKLAWDVWHLTGQGADPDQVNKALDKLVEAKDAAVRSVVELDKQ